MHSIVKMRSGTNLGLCELALETLDCTLSLLQLCAGVLQLSLQKLCGLFVAGHHVVGFEPSILQLLIVDTQSLENKTRKCLSPCVNRLIQSNKLHFLI